MVGPTTIAKKGISGALGALARSVYAQEAAAAGRFGVKRYGAMAEMLNRPTSALPRIGRMSDALMPAASRDVDLPGALPAALLATIGAGGALGYADANNPRQQAKGHPELLSILDQVEGAHGRARMQEDAFDYLDSASSPFTQRMGDLQSRMNELEATRDRMPAPLPPFLENAVNYRHTLDATPLEPGVAAALARERARIRSAPQRVVAEPDPYVDTGLTPEERRALLARSGRAPRRR